MAKPNKGKGLGAMNTIVTKLLMALDDNYVSTLNLNEKNAEVKSRINDQLDLAKGTSGGSIIDFTRQNIVASKKNNNVSSNDQNDILNFIKHNSGSLYQSYIERNKNRFVETKDLKFVSKFIPSLGQAVKIALTHIVSSDDLSGAVKRGIDLGKGVNDEEAALVMDAIEKFENETNLLLKLKNFVYYNSLVSGNHYVYAVSYKKLFEQYSRAKAVAKKMGGSKTESVPSLSLSSVPASESVTYDKFIDTDTGALTIKCALESAQIDEIRNGISFEGAVLNGKKLTDEKNFRNGVINAIADVYICESAIPENIMDMMEIAVEAADHDRGEFGNKMRDKIDKALEELKDEKFQYPPIYSAIKVNGKKLYDYALQNKEVEILPRPIKIEKLKRVSEYKDKHVKIEILANKGFYVRSLIHDLGIKLNTYATMSELCRISAGVYNIENAQNLGDEYTIHTIEEVFNHLDKIEVNDYIAKLIKNGVVLDERQYSKNEMFKVYNNDKLIAIYEPINEKEYKIIVYLGD